MIIMSFFASLASFCGVLKTSITNLVIIIIGIRVCVSLLFYGKFGSILALIWVLVYLGGIIVCFIYISFITLSDNNISQSFRRASENNRLLILIFFFIVVCKTVSVRSGNFGNFHLDSWSSSVILFNETYSQIVSQSPFFFLISAIILLYGLMQVLSIFMLKTKVRLSCCL